MNLPKKVTPVETKVESNDIFSEVGLDIKWGLNDLIIDRVEVGNRSATMLNKSMLPSTVHVSQSSPITQPEPGEITGTGWDDDELDL